MTRHIPTIFLLAIVMLVIGWPGNAILDGQERKASTSSIQVQLPPSAGDGAVSGRQIGRAH
ncbi:MAG: hypothetical protein VB855_05015, partial [Pirellulaceae bacterium]